MANKIKTNDYVIILAGKEKGKKGFVKKINYKKNTVIIENVNIVTKHQKPIPSHNQEGKIIKKEASIHISNIAIFNTKKNRIEKIKFSYIRGKKMRFFKSNSHIFLDK